MVTASSGTLQKLALLVFPDSSSIFLFPDGASAASGLQAISRTIHAFRGLSKILLNAFPFRFLPMSTSYLTVFSAPTKLFRLPADPCRFLEIPMDSFRFPRAPLDACRFICIPRVSIKPLRIHQVL